MIYYRQSRGIEESYYLLKFLSAFDYPTSDLVEDRAFLNT